MRVQAAWVWEQPNFRVADSFFLQPKPRLRLVKGHPISPETEHRQRSRLISLYFFRERFAALDYLFSRELIGPRGRPLAKTGDPVPALQQFVLLPWLQLPGRKTGLVQHLPEAVSRLGKMQPVAPE